MAPAEDKVHLLCERLKLLSSEEENPLGGLGRYNNVLFALVTMCFHQPPERSDGLHA